MKIQINLMVEGEKLKEDEIEIEDHKIEDLTEDELQEVIDINIRDWVNQKIQITWEAPEK